MVTIERKSKFNKSKATYRKRDKRRKDKPQFYSMINKKLIMGVNKTKTITNKVIDKLVKDKTVVSISYTNYDRIGRGIIVNYNLSYLVFVNFTEYTDYGTLDLINFNKIKKIEIVKNSSNLEIKNKFNISNQQYKYFSERKNVLDSLPEEIEDLIVEKVDIKNYYEANNFNIENKKEFFSFLKKNLFSKKSCNTFLC